jgi:predicted alpha-1,2-mannosidase
MEKKIKTIIGLLFIFSLSFSQKPNKLRGGHHNVINTKLTPADYVNTYIGFKSSNTQITAQLPWGMASMGPNFVPRFTEDSINMKIHGFGSLHLSGVGCGQFQTGITFIPTTGELKYSLVDNSSTFSKEITSPGYYKNRLDKFGVVSEMTATERTGIIRMVFPEGQSNIIIDLGQKLSGSPTHWSSIVKISDTELEGYMSESAFCAGESGHEVYFVIKLNKKIQQAEFYEKGKVQYGVSNELWSDKVALGLTFKTSKDDTLEASIGLSYTSIINARINLETEQKDRKFADIKRQAFNTWNEELSKMTVEGGAENDKTIFYTGLYHVLFHPHIISDANGYYPAMNSRDIRKSDFIRYSTYSLWDTYRNLHPFLALVYPERQLDMVRSIIGMYKDGGWLPKWEHASLETNNMNGDPSIPVIADTYLKGLKDFDVQAALEGMKKQSLNTPAGFKLRPGIDKYLQYGYIPNDDKGLYYVWGSVATTLEYTFADWSIARMAEAMGKKDDADEYYRRAKFYKNVFDKETGFMRPKLKNGKFYVPFDPATTCGEKGPDVCWAGGMGFVEGNSWQYTFMVPHDQPGLIKLMGGEKAYVNKLQELFDSK